MGNSVGNKATAGVLLERTAHPGVYRRGGQYVAVYRREGRQRKESAATFTEARALKLARDAEASEQRRGPTLHDYALRWVARHTGSGHDSVREQTREEYRRLLATFALSCFPADIRLADLDRRALQGFIGWLTDRPGRRGRLSDRSIRNALTPLRRCLAAAAGEGLIDSDLMRSLVLPSRRGGRRWAVSERRFLTRVQLGNCLLRSRRYTSRCTCCWPPRGCASRRRSRCAGATWTSTQGHRGCRYEGQSSVVSPALRSPTTAPARSRWPRSSPEDCVRMRPLDAEDEDLVFPNRRGRPLNPNNLRTRVLKPAAKRADVPGIGLHALRHTCASLLIEERTSSLRLQRWMGHHAAAYTLETYGHLIDDEFGRALELADLGVRDRWEVKPALTDPRLDSLNGDHRLGGSWVSSPAIVVALTPGRYAQVAVLSCACQ
jgi:integrase